MKNKVLRLPANIKGKDFVVGDVHGCFEDLLLALKAINFNETTDRLLSVGDWIDRGPNSLECISMLDKDWVYSVLGNHEWMMIETILYNNYNSAQTWLSNGGDWSLKQSRNVLVPLATKLYELPLVIVVGEGEERFNIVHAELLSSNEKDHNGASDKDIDNWTFKEKEEWDMIWGRSIAQYTHYFTPELLARIQGNLSITYCGHTPMRSLKKVCKQMFLDRGCVYYHKDTNKSEQHALAIACHQDKVVYEWNPMWKRITKIPYANIDNK